MTKTLWLVMLMVIVIIASGCSEKNQEKEDDYIMTLQEENAEVNSVNDTSDNKPEISKAPEANIPYQVNQLLEELDKRNQEWIQAFHADDDSLKAFYMDNALLFPSKDKYIQGAESIRDFYKSYGDSFGIKEFYVDFRVQLTENRNMIYETGSFITDTDETYQYLTLWTKSNNVWLHELDAISFKASNLTTDPSIDTARDKWVEAANAHSAKNLTENLYNPDFVYYNRGNLYEGYENLTGAYSYMNNENFNIKLTSDICVMVQPDLAYEIGSWTSNGTGKYIIIWNYVEDRWGIHLDVNW